MTTVFIGGSRHVSRLPVPIKERLHRVVENQHHVIVGDANGVDKAVQKHFAEANYGQVTVFCSGDKPRNNVGDWPIHSVSPPSSARGFQFYAAKDREMAREADFGLMIWDGKSAGTVLNVLRLVQSGKIAVLANVPAKQTLNVKSPESLALFFQELGTALQEDLKQRATPDEWAFVASDPQLGLYQSDEQPISDSTLKTDWASEMSVALNDYSLHRFFEALGEAAKLRGMSMIASETGLSRESLYRSLGADGNPEFATVLKVVNALGLQLQLTSKDGQS